MKINGAVRINMSLIGVAVVTASILIFGVGYLSFGLVAFHVVVTAAMARFDPLHPAVWFVPFLFVYHFSSILTHLLGIRFLTSPEDVLLVAWLGIAAASLGLSFFQVSSRAPSRHVMASWGVVMPALYSITFIFAAMINILFIRMGVDSKADAVNIGITSLYPLFSWFLLCSCAAFFVSAKQRLLVFVLTLGLLGFTALNLGERNFLFAFVVFVILSLFYQGILSRLHLLFFAAVILCLIPVFGFMKNVFQGGIEEFGFIDIALGVVDGEFRTGGYNLDVILSNPEQWVFFHGETYFSGLVKSFIPSFIVDLEGAVGWYNKTFHPDILAAGRGYGFSLLAEAYINFGGIGVLLFFFVWSIVLGWGYNSAMHSVSSGKAFLYIYLIPIVIYSIRADLSNIVSPLLKSVLLPSVLAMFLIVILKIISIRIKGNHMESTR